MIDPKKKISGVLIPLFALRREGDLGIGDTASMADAIDFCSRTGLTVLQLLPINETGGDNSPYNAISSVALDSVYLTVEPGVIPGLKKEEFEKIIADSAFKGSSPDSVNYALVKNLKLKLLKAAWNNFKAEGSADALSKFAAFEKENISWLKSYSLFRTLIDRHAGNACWTQWEPELQTLDSAEKYLLSSADKELLSDLRRFYSFVQWLAFTQWLDIRKYADRKNIRLMGDIPFGISRYSVDVWAERELFDLDWSGGAPPEPFFQVDLFTRKWGQNWGIPLYRWQMHERENYRWWRQRVKQQTNIFHYFRIDHVLGFFRVYAFPWIPERNEEFFDLNEDEAKALTAGRLPQFLPRPDYPENLGKLNAVDGKTILKVILAAAAGDGVVAEDLGMVPDYVRPLLHKLGIPGFAIPIFERHEEDQSFKRKEELHPLSLATYGTHDHWPLALFYEDLVARWHGADGHEAWLDVQRLMRFLGLDENNPPLQFTDELHMSFCKTLLESPCWLTVFMITDLLGSRERFNVPGLASNSNWSCRLPMSLADYEKDPLFGKKIKSFSVLLKQTQRLKETLPAGTIR